MCSPLDGERVISLAASLSGGLAGASLLRNNLSGGVAAPSGVVTLPGGGSAAPASCRAPSSAPSMLFSFLLDFVSDSPALAD